MNGKSSKSILSNTSLSSATSLENGESLLETWAEFGRRGGLIDSVRDEGWRGEDKRKERSRIAETTRRGAK